MAGEQFCLLLTRGGRTGKERRPNVVTCAGIPGPQPRERTGPVVSDGYDLRRVTGTSESTDEASVAGARAVGSGRFCNAVC